jgi:Protein of unknown function (DUF1326)
MAATTATITAAASTIGKIPKWKVIGDWFDVCKCSMPCPCEFAQTPTYGDCILAYNIKKGNYGETSLDDLNVILVTSFEGNIWAGDGKTKVDLALFFDEKADEKQREALNMIFHTFISCNLGHNWDSSAYWMVLCPRHIINATGNK